MSENMINFNIDEFLKEFSVCLEPNEFIHFINNTNSNNEVFIELTILEKLKNRKKVIDKEKNREQDGQKIYQEAKNLELIDINKAIRLYESIINVNLHRDVLDRLIILYRKMKNKKEEIRILKFLIEEEQNKEYNRMTFLISKNPILEKEIRNCYNNDLTFIEPVHGFRINFNTKINRLKSRLDKLEK
ncbi:hypothetical protein SAMN05660477_00013 [Soonwooa buanensis]|uniref:Uncharacterized protein n=1 Tax=Soonwooa buanensis TaxID=619805 RepID=A0A1T5CEU3_9FLAO|nr:hypothetical protein [Soonwooa buanensis]SKB57939.1 hypothetical protein SAMN05660477_00013 [Soonwooa buanensis]